MKSVLPKSLEAKRVLSAKEHAKAVFVLLGGVYAMVVACILLLLYRPANIPASQMKLLVFGILILVVPTIVVLGIFRLLRQNDERCHQPGLVCPRCGKPLYEPKGIVHLTGRCPKCNQGLTASTIRQDERVQLSKLKPTVELDAVAVIEVLAVGTRIKLVCLVALDQQSKSPPFIYAEPGEAGEIKGYATPECYWATAGGRPETFLAWPDEFEVNEPA